MSGTLGLSSPWARQAIPSQTERDAIAATIPDGYTVGVYCNSDRSMYGVRVIEQGETWATNRVVWGGDEQRHYFRDPRVGIQTAVGWIVAHAVPA
jgi:hypothetical protein